MKLNKLLIAATVFSAASIFSTQSHAQNNNFNNNRDILICQFDNLPDTDDIYSQAALAGFLAHPDQEGVNYFCAAGAWGTQATNSRFDYDDTRELMNLGFGREAVRGDNTSERAESRWVDSHGEIIRGLVNGLVPRSRERVENLDFASDVIAARVQPILEAGGRVFVAEAGQSDLTADWVEKLVEAGVRNTDDNVIIVQHSSFNRNNTAGGSRLFDDRNDDLGFLREGDVSNYVMIDDGNRENDTPDYTDTSRTFLQEALSRNNPSPYTRDLWEVATRLAEESTYQVGGGTIRDGGVDFSDHVEVLYIFDLSDESDGLHTVREYWDEYVLNSEITGAPGTETPEPPVEDPPPVPPVPPAPAPPAPPVTGNVVCAVTADNRPAAERLYAQQCAGLARVDCDPFRGDEVCANIWLTSANTDAYFSAQRSGINAICTVTASDRFTAEQVYAQQCGSIARVDCDPFRGNEVCASLRLTPANINDYYLP